MILVKYQRKEIKRLEDEQLEALLKAAYEAKRDLREKQKIVKDAQKVIIKRAHDEGLTGNGSYLLVAEGAKVRVKNYRDVEIQDYVSVKEILGEKADEYMQVETQVVVKPTKKMLELLSDGDSELGKRLRKYVVIKAKTQVEWP